MTQLGVTTQVKAGRELLEGEERRKAGELRHRVRMGLHGSSSSSLGGVSNARSSMHSRAAAGHGVITV